MDEGRTKALHAEVRLPYMLDWMPSVHADLQCEAGAVQRRVSENRHPAISILDRGYRSCLHLSKRR